MRIAKNCRKQSKIGFRDFRKSTHITKPESAEVSELDDIPSLGVLAEFLSLRVACHCSRTGHS